MFCKYFQHIHLVVIFLEVSSQSFNQFRYLSHIFCLEKRSEAKRSEAKRSEADRGGSRNEVGGGEAVWRRAMSCNYTYSYVYNSTYSYNYYNSAE